MSMGNDWEEALSLDQEGTVQEYCDTFEAKFNTVNMCEVYAVYLFISGLRPEIAEVLKRRHNIISNLTLKEAFSLARIQELSTYSRVSTYVYQQENSSITHSYNESDKEIKTAHKVFDEMPKRVGDDFKEFMDESDSRDKIQETIGVLFDTNQEHWVVTHNNAQREIGVLDPDLQNKIYGKVQFRPWLDKFSFRLLVNQVKYDENVRVLGLTLTKELASWKGTKRLNYYLSDTGWEQIENSGKNDYGFQFVGIFDDVIMTVKLRACHQDIIKEALLLLLIANVIDQDLFKMKAWVYMWHKWKTKSGSAKISSEGLLQSLTYLCFHAFCLHQSWLHIIMGLNFWFTYYEWFEILKCGDILAMYDGHIIDVTFANITRLNQQIKRVLLNDDISYKKKAYFEMVWYSHFPHTPFVECKSGRNLNTVDKDKFRFSKGDALFLNTIQQYLYLISRMIPEIVLGNHTRVELGVKCGVPRFGAYLFSRDVLKMSTAQNDMHGKDIQIAVECGKLVRVITFKAKRLSYSSQNYATFVHVVVRLYLVVHPYLLKRNKGDVEHTLSHKKEIILYASFTKHHWKFQDRPVNKSMEKHTREHRSKIKNRTCSFGFFLFKSSDCLRQGQSILKLSSQQFKVHAETVFLQEIRVKKFVETLKNTTSRKPTIICYGKMSLILRVTGSRSQSKGCYVFKAVAMEHKCPSTPAWHVNKTAPNANGRFEWRPPWNGSK